MIPKTCITDNIFDIYFVVKYDLYVHFSCISLYKTNQRVIQNETYFTIKTLLKPMLKVVDTCINTIVYIEYCSSLVQINSKNCKNKNDNKSTSKCNYFITRV